MFRALLTANEWLQRAAAAAARCMLIALLLLVLASFTTRALGITATFAEEFTRYSVIGLVALGVGYTLLRRRHVRTGALADRLPPPARHLLEVVSGGLSAFLFGVVLYSTWGMWTLSMAWGMKSNTDIEFPLWPVQFMLFAGFLLLMLQTLADTAKAAAAFMSGVRRSGRDRA
ncbi:TRAP transporter small permease [Pikeienuella sp. HZG-20]|uniref:TRAP transporter small permease n=1 Tax=Paludibacillus litoralis TaxID=3133267 RepID=UPI0030EC9D92